MSTTKNTIISLLLRLIDKGFLKTNKIGRRNKYTALVSEAEYQAVQTESFLEKIYEGDAKELISTLIQRDLISADEYEDLKSIGKAVARWNEWAIKNYPVINYFWGLTDFCFARVQAFDKGQIKQKMAVLYLADCCCPFTAPHCPGNEPYGNGFSAF